MRKIVEYKTLYHIHGHELDDAIKLWLDKGWELYGSPYSCNHDYLGQCMCQAMVKYEEEK